MIGAAAARSDRQRANQASGPRGANGGLGDALAEPARSADARRRFRRQALWGLVAAFAAVSATVVQLLKRQVAGTDFSCFWAGAKAAVDAIPRLYDFDYITALQGWPLGPGAVRPYVNPPSALAIFIPFALPPYWLGYGLWVGLTGALFLAVGLKAKAPWWFILMPPVVFAAYCGQVTFLVGGLVLAGLTFRERGVLAGILFGVAASVKPQLLVLLPIALMAERRWSTIFATAATGLLLVGFSVAIWGLQPWLDWFAALHRLWPLLFANSALVANMVSPYAALAARGWNGAWAFLLIPPVVVGVWLTFRRNASLADRSLVLLGGALLISPYAMNYELALLAPAFATYLNRTQDRRWPAYVVASVAYVGSAPIFGLIAAIALVPLRNMAPSLQRTLPRFKRRAATGLGLG
ncbi:MAG: hypothetical protein JWO72_2380 [Caulobacteraceae bacterium]|nr:hypothetical protein [Caulobacteraceae bacterium]